MKRLKEVIISGLVGIVLSGCGSRDTVHFNRVRDPARIYYQDGKYIDLYEDENREVNKMVFSDDNQSGKVVHPRAEIYPRSFRDNLSAYLKLREKIVSEINKFE